MLKVTTPNKTIKRNIVRNLIAGLCNNKKLSETVLGKLLESTVPI